MLGKQANKASACASLKTKFEQKAETTIEAVNESSIRMR